MPVDMREGDSPASGAIVVVAGGVVSMLGATGSSRRVVLAIVAVVAGGSARAWPACGVGRRADPPEGSPPGTIRRWVRLKDRSGLDPVGELVGIGDALPPGSARAMQRMGPISSITWALTILGEVPPTRDGWWLLETRSNHMANGFSSETLRLWNSEGVEVMHGLQSVAVFG